MRILMTTLSALTVGLTLATSHILSAAPASAQPHQMMKTKSLYDRLGGKAAIQAVVDDFVGNVAADNRINKFFAKTNIPRLKQRLVEQICQGTGGPCKYKGRSMKAVHRGMGVGGADFGALVEDLKLSLNKFQVPAREQGELLAILGPMKKDIVEKK
jgi:hemoglobin